MSTHLGGLIGVVLLSIAPCLAEKSLPVGESLLPGEYVDQLKPGVTKKMSVELVDVTGQPFTKAARIRTLQRLSRFYEAQLSVKTTTALKKGTLTHIRFYAKGTAPKNETGEAEVQVYFQENKPPYRKALSEHVSVGSEWTRLDYPLVIDRDYAAGEASLYFGVGFNEQTLELGGVQLLRFDSKVKRGDLPRTPVRYPGSAADAAWRREAAARIEKFRKADLEVRVTDAEGKAVPDATIRVNMKKHAFGFSSIINVNFLNSNDPNVEPYRKTVLKMFNASGNENALKWPMWEGEQRRTGGHQPTLKVLKWLKENGFFVRGHVFVWPSWKHLPKGVQAHKDSPDEIRRLVREHIRDVALTTRDYVDEYDVINETRSNHDLMDLCGREVMVDWFKCAREVLPTQDLFINDYGILNSGLGSSNQKTYRDTVQFLLDHGAPVTGIGFQGHLGSRLPDPGTVVRILDDFGKLGLKMRITEFDLDLDDEQTQANYTRDFLTAVFSHPGVVGFQMWGFWEGRHWKPRGALFRRDWSPKPNAEAYRDLVFNQWWTREEGKTDAEGRLKTRGFLGDYEITVEREGKTQTVDAKLTRDSKPVQVVLR